MQINWEKWVGGGGDQKWMPLRQAVHTVLLAIANCESLKSHMMLKGGILMALCYDSTRYTRDIDLSQTSKYQTGDESKLLEELQAAIQDSVQELSYGLDCKVQSSQLKPPSEKNPTFPVLEVKIGYAYNDDKKNHPRLVAGTCTNVLEIDFSFNEKTKSAEEFEIAEGQSLLRYSLLDLVAEKFRALLQQEMRKRYRGQDLYDLLYLIRRVPNQLQSLKPEILDALLVSAQSKELMLTVSSMGEGEIRAMTQHDYDLLQDTVAAGSLEKFDIAYEEVRRFYTSLPWPNVAKT
ncbi:MAG: nucleotidyl transferase AbiEii/AbiGii toxin family protein [Methylophilaceae bacterium]